MDFARYCANNSSYASIFDAENNEIGWGRFWQSNSKFLEVHYKDKYALAHLCNCSKEFRCNKQCCEHAKNGIVPIMTIKTRLSWKKYYLILLNEEFITYQDYTSQRNSLIQKRSFISYGEKWSNSLNFYYGTVLQCICGQFKLTSGWKY